MAKLSIKAGATSQTVNCFVQNNSVTTGAGLTGLAYNTASLIAYYCFPGAAPVAITLATLAANNSAWATGGFKEIDSSHMAGLYRLDIPNAALASGNGRFVTIILSGATNMAPCVLEIELTAVDNQDGVHGGMSAIPNATAGASGGLTICGSNAATTFATMTVTGATTFTGNVSMAAGCTITQSTTNAAGLSITGNGSGAGTSISGGSSGDALDLTGHNYGINIQASSYGIYVNSTGSDALHLVGSTYGIYVTGSGFAGLLVTCAGSGDAAQFVGGSSGHGITATGIGPGKHGLNLTGGNASGSSPAGNAINAVGGAASTTAGGTAGNGVNATGGAGAASTNGAGGGVVYAGGGTTTVSGAPGMTLTGTGNADGLHAAGAGTGYDINCAGSTTVHGSLTGDVQGKLLGGGSSSLTAVAAQVDLQTIKTQTVTCAQAVTINANVGSAQPLNFTGTGASAYVQCDPRAWGGTTLVSPFYAPQFAPPLRLISDTFTRPTSGIFAQAVDQRMPETGPWPWDLWTGDYVITNGRIVSPFGTADSSALTTAYLSDGYTLSVIINLNGAAADDMGLVFRASDTDNQNTAYTTWYAAVNTANGHLTLGTFTEAGGYTEVAFAPLLGSFVNSIDHLLTVKVNGTTISAILDGPVGGNIVAVSTTSSTYQTQPFVGVGSSMINTSTSSNGKNFANFALDAPTPVQPFGTITAATNASPIVITSNGHGRTTGDTLAIAGNVTGNTNMLARQWTITVVDSNRFSLNGSHGNGSFTGTAQWWLTNAVAPLPWSYGPRATITSAQDLAYTLLTDTNSTDLGTPGSLGGIAKQLGGAFTSNSSSIFSAASMAPQTTAIWQDLVTSSDLTATGSIGAYLITQLGKLSISPIVVQNQPSPQGPITIIRDTDMFASETRQIDVPSPSGTDISTATSLSLYVSGQLVCTGTYVLSGSTQLARFQPTAAQTLGLRPGLSQPYQVLAVLANGHKVSLVAATSKANVFNSEEPGLA